MSNSAVKRYGSNHPVVAVNPNGTIAGCFDYVKDAARYCGVDRHRITDRCKKGTVLNGLRWYYEEDFQKIFMEKGSEGLKFNLPPTDPITGKILSEVKRKKSWSAEAKRMRSLMSKEICRRMNENPNSNFGRYRKSPSVMSKKVICVNSGEIFPSAAECSRRIGANPSSFNRSLRKSSLYRGKKYLYLSVYEEVQRRINSKAVI